MAQEKVVNCKSKEEVIKEVQNLNPRFDTRTYFTWGGGYSARVFHESVFNAPYMKYIRVGIMAGGGYRKIMEKEVSYGTGQSQVATAEKAWKACQTQLLSILKAIKEDK